jgi:hypothetical protein
LIFQAIEALTSQVAVLTRTTNRPSSLGTLRTTTLQVASDIQTA